MLDRITGAMSRADRRAWSHATTLADLGGLMARWLEQDGIRSRPGYRAGHGPEGETTDLVVILARLNRAGFVTDQSQPGAIIELDGGVVRQRAAVEGFTDLVRAARIVNAAQRAGLWANRSNAPRWRADTSWHRAVTADENREWTRFGAVMSRREIGVLWSPPLGQAAVTTLQDAQQVTVIDPEWGRFYPLWNVLTRELNGDK